MKRELPAAPAVVAASTPAISPTAPRRASSTSAKGTAGALVPGRGRLSSRHLRSPIDYSRKTSAQLRVAGGDASLVRRMPVVRRLFARLRPDGRCASKASQGASPPLCHRGRTIATTARTGIAAPEITFDAEQPPNASKARIIPASPSYFTGQPAFTDTLVYLQSLLQKYNHLPRISRANLPPISWVSLREYRSQIGESVRESRYERVKVVLNRLRDIHPDVQPKEIRDAIENHRRAWDASTLNTTVHVLDDFGRAYAQGGRKRSRANVFLVEGEGEVLINNRNITQYFGRVHDRESALWPLKLTDRLGKYNVWATVHGGGTTGQAESLTLGIAKALLVHEPALKPALRRGGCITRDQRKVERKKPGHLKARKMPQWVKR